MANMGLDYGLEKPNSCIKRKFRWLLKIPDISASGIKSLPPMKSARPNISFKEIQAEHLNETIYFPSKPEWKPITLTLFDLKKNQHPVINWLNKLYNACTGKMQTPIDNDFIQYAILEMYDGSGAIMETWIYEDVWPQAIDFEDLDMSSSEIVTCSITLRYARAYLEDHCTTR